MVADMVQEAVQTLHIVQEIEIAAPVGVAFEALLEQLGPASAAGIATSGTGWATSGRTCR